MKRSTTWLILTIGFALWHINHCSLFNAKLSLYINIKYVVEPWYNYKYTYTCGNIINNNDERTHFYRKIYLSHFILERVAKGLISVMCEKWVGDRDRQQHIDPKFLCSSSTYSSFCWAAQPGSWGPKPSVWRWLSLRHVDPNCDWNSNCDCNSNWTLLASDSNRLKPSVAPGYIIVWHPPASCGRRMCTKFNPSIDQSDIPISSTGCTCFLIDGLVEGQYVTNPLNRRRSARKESQGNTSVRKFIQGIRFHL